MKSSWLFLTMCLLLSSCAHQDFRQEKQRGLASWYGPGFQGHRTASGEKFDMNQMTAAHRTLPLGMKVRVRNLTSGREVTVRINDRGPFASNRVIDLSYAAAKKLGLVDTGVQEVEISTENVANAGLDSTYQNLSARLSVK